MNLRQSLCTSGVSSRGPLCQRQTGRVYTQNSNRRCHQYLCRAEKDASSSSSTSSSSRSSANEHVSILGITSGRGMSMKQRQRAFHMYFHSWMTRMVQDVALLRTVAMWINGHVIPAWRRYMDGFRVRKDAWIEAYEQYLAEETKERWSWEKRHRNELALLESIPPYIGMVVATLLYETFVPLSVTCAVLLPLYFSWILYDRWWTSPILLGMILISPWKGFLSFSGTWSILWPTLI